MKTSQKIYVWPWIIVIVALFLIGTGVYNFAKTKNGQPDLSVSELKTYTTPVFPFSISYPSDFALASDLSTTQQQKVTSYMGACSYTSVYKSPNDNIICYVGDQKSDGFEEAALSITVPSTSAQDCQKPEANESGPITQQTTTTINGVTFYKNQLAEAGLGHYQSIDSYRTYYNGTCYTLDLKIDSNRGVAEKGLNADFSNMMRAKLEAILATFKFIPVANSVSGLKTYINSQYGFSIGYPVVGDVSEGLKTNNSENPGASFTVGLHSNDGSGWPKTALNIDIEERVPMNPCADHFKGTNIIPTIVTINGINFTKGDVSGNYSDNNTNAYADEYCTTYSHFVYRLTSQMYYPGTGNSSYSATSTPSHSDFENNQVINEVINSFKFITTNNDSLLISKAQLTGVWQASPMMAAGWADRYQFFADGKYNYRISQEACDMREKGRSGNWNIIDNNLELQAKISYEVFGGTIVKSTLCGSGKEIQGGVMQPDPFGKIPTESLVISTCSKPEESPYQCLSIGGEQFYKFANDPMYHNSSDIEGEPDF